MSWALSTLWLFTAQGEGSGRTGKDVLPARLILQCFRALVLHLRKETTRFWGSQATCRYLTPHKLVLESGPELQGKPAGNSRVKKIIPAYAIKSLSIPLWLSGSLEIGAINANRCPAMPPRLLTNFSSCLNRGQLQCLPELYPWLDLNGYLPTHPPPPPTRAQ